MSETRINAIAYDYWVIGTALIKDVNIISVPCVVAMNITMFHFGLVLCE